MAVIYTTGGHQIEEIWPGRDEINEKIRSARDTGDPVIEVERQPENPSRRGKLTIFHKHIVAVGD